MSNSAGHARGGGRGLLFALGAGLGAAGILLLISRRPRSEPRPTGVPLPLPKEVPLPDEPPPKAAEPEPEPEPLTEPLSVEANPNPIVRGRPVTVRARTRPGATCRLDARYSTGFAPRSMHGEVQTAGEDGTCRWQWVVRTRGDGLRIVVKATLEDGTTAQRTRRVKVVDED